MEAGEVSVEERSGLVIRQCRWAQSLRLEQLRKATVLRLSCTGSMMQADLDTLPTSMHNLQISRPCFKN